MTERHSFLRAIRESPDDDTPRLVFADWLEEHGEPERAEFIRCQIDLAKVKGTQDPNCRRAAEQLRINGRPGEAHAYVEPGTMRPVPCSACWSELRRREKELWKEHAYDWLENWLGAEQLAVEPNAGAVAFSTMPPNSAKFEFRRGFLSKVFLSWEDAAAHLDSILADPWVPGLDEVELTTEPEAESIDRDGILWAFSDLPVNHRIYRRFFDITMTPGNTSGMRIDERMLRQAWPDVRDWELPPEADEVTARDVEAVLVERANA